ncbi:MAG: tRNA(Ile)-lysidine synthase [Patescibacteria group bacterium]|nr:tRNA(Ile)-lysidine synthase [Patescibacteria group bacterium]
MNIQVPSGHYVLAVSGGVDSMVLLDIMRQLPDVRVTVAHFDHGIRDDSHQDRQLIQDVTRAHQIPFVYNKGDLGAGTSEAVARQARYEFLHQARQASGAGAIITAHHQDDRLETAIINLIRGTGRKGLSSLRSTDVVVRPLLGYDKQQIKDYAQAHNIQWREDSTNSDDAYLRNYVRQNITSKFTPAQRQQLLQYIDSAQHTNQELEQLLAVQLHIQPALDQINRSWFIRLPHDVAKEVLASWLRRHQVEFDRKGLERLVVAAKTYQPHKRADISAGYYLDVQAKYLALGRPDR